MQTWTESAVESQPKDIDHIDRENPHKPLVSMQKQLQNAMRSFGSTFELRIIDPLATSEQNRSRAEDALFAYPSSSADVDRFLDDMSEILDGLANSQHIPSPSSGRGGFGTLAGGGIASGSGGNRGSPRGGYRGRYRGGSHSPYIGPHPSLLDTPDRSKDGTTSPRGRNQVFGGLNVRGGSFPRGGRGPGPALSSASSPLSFRPALDREEDEEEVVSLAVVDLTIAAVGDMAAVLTDDASYSEELSTRRRAAMYEGQCNGIR